MSESVKQTRVQIDETRRLICVVDARDEEGGILVELPDEFLPEELRDWVLTKRKKLVCEPLPEPVPEPTEQDIVAEVSLQNAYDIILLKWGLLG